MKSIKPTLVLLALSIFVSISAQSTGKNKKAEKDFNGYSYTKAIEKYEALAIKTTEINRKLAESYLRIGNTEKAEIYYAIVVNSVDKTPLDVYNYSSVLFKNGKYNDAEKWMNEYYDLASSDSRALEYKSNHQDNLLHQLKMEIYLEQQHNHH